MNEKPVEQPQTSPAPASTSTTSPSDGDHRLPSAASALSSALKGFIETLQQQTARHTDIIDIFARALKEMNRELKQEKARREIAERHLQDAESRLGRLEKTVQALARQSWVH